MKKVYVHELTGLKPDILATYLASLGILRILSEQRDGNIRGFWRNEHFVLVSELDWPEVEQFFLEEYSPTPILAPWNGGGGFLDQADDDPADGSEIGNDPVQQLLRFNAPRFDAIRAAIAEAQCVIPDVLPLARGERDKLTTELRERKRAVRGLETGSPEYQSAVDQVVRVEKLREMARKRVEEVKAEVKGTLLRQTGQAWHGPARDWFDASVVLDAIGQPSYSFHFGTGGNEGNQDYTTGFQRNLIRLFLQDGMPAVTARARLVSVLFGNRAPVLVRQTFGQFSPGRAGGTNMGTGFDGHSGLNPWEFVLALEGGVVLVPGFSRRGGVRGARISSPFWVEGASAGFASASMRERNKGPPRGEQWLPLWSQPVRYDEFSELVREGRAQVGRKPTTAATDFVRAAARLGFARGIDGLQRFSYLQRNGESTFAVSVGRFRVTSRSRQPLLDEVAPWIEQLVRHSREKNAPMRLSVIARRTQEALFAVCRQEAVPTLWRELLATLGEAELVLLRAGKSLARRPLPRLSGGWVAAVDDGTQEGRTTLRLALALASQHRPRKPDDAALVDPVRRHFLPLDDWEKRSQFKLDEEGCVTRDAEYVCVGRDLVTDAIALVKRRSIWTRGSNAKRQHAPLLPLEATRFCEATLEEIGAWLRREVADEAVLRLVRPLLALDWHQIAEGGSTVPPERGETPEPLHMLLRLAHLPFNVLVSGPDGQTEAAVTVRLDPEPLRRLAAGDLDGALKVAMRRLGACGLRPVFRRAVCTPEFARRLAASLAFPISREDARRAAQLVCKPHDVRDPEERLSTPV